MRRLRYRIYEREKFTPPSEMFFQNDGANLKVMESGIRALPVALALRFPGDYLPWGSGGQQGASL